MKYIHKNPEPGSLTGYNDRLRNKTPNWKSFNKSVKTDVYHALLKEQGHICCYCGIRIFRKNCHIEHYRPKSQYKHLTFSYTNLIVSCQGEDEQRPTKPVHCGHKKGAWFDEDLMISPLDPNCPDYFKYTGSGEILAADNPDKLDAAETTIAKLALNINKLTKMRRKAIDAALQIVEELDDGEIHTLAQAYQEMDSEGQYTPFWAAVAYTFKQYF
ncbi:retron system putative HNH endonuclease [Mastigocoleus testarum]|uniref:TIGR02646 family protein n=1 Tax=Mastigocoleus testarum BC008 TaxID=371196 RepID=A0A0V7ZWN5_9CYAN|nr:retron system putative HNH endonuclease [Mastigocoleus testarum]KST63089.1 hypothetical protein BC008_12330 [Mastigocoleus testarum BC008]KST69053.1 hypothetical protein BC008_34570 [Mastigocoleus testarum BC008]